MRHSQLPGLPCAALLAVLLLPGQGAAAQEAPPPADPPPAPRGAALPRPATVNGQSITGEDITQHLRLLGEERLRGTPEERRHTSQRMIAEEILLSGEASRLGVELTERDVDEYWNHRRGSVPDYEAMAKELGTSEERQRELARRAALSELYLLHRVGLRTDLGQRLPPDPILVRLVTVTPSQLREAFAVNKDYLGQPATVACDMYACSAAAGSVPVLEQGLAQGVAPEGAEPLRRTFPVPALAQMFPPELAEFLAAAEPGAVKGAAASDGVLLLRVVERQPGLPADFVSGQENLRRMLQNELLGEARAQIVDTLASQATFWPRDLFAAGSAPPVASPAPAALSAPAAPSATAPSAESTQSAESAGSGPPAGQASAPSAGSAPGSVANPQGSP